MSPDSSGDEGNGAPGVPRPDYDSVEVNTKAPVADVAVGKPKVASRSTGYNNIPAQPEPPNLQSGNGTCGAYSNCVNHVTMSGSVVLHVCICR